MKYIRTKDGIFESDKTIFGEHTKIIISNKKTNQVITEIICDCIEEKSIIEDMLFAEYCKTHKINPLDYSRKTIVLNPAVIAQADTIEELCDECISVLENGKGSHIWHESDFEEKTPYLFHNARMFKEDDEIIYGAIWTDKGLIYVAKMNEKGELELL